MRRFGIAILVGIAMVLGIAASGLAAKGGSADLAITKTDSPDPVGMGTTLTYTIGVQNLGPDMATGVTVTDQLPKAVDFVSAAPTTGTCGHKDRRVTCDLGSLGTPSINYAPAHVTITVVPRKAGAITNTASVKGNEKDPVGANDKASATTTVTAPATCRGTPATIVGTAGDDNLVGTPHRDVIVAFQGNDKIATLGGRDLVCAGAGADRVSAGAGADRIFGGAGRDRLLGRGGPDVLKGGPGRDVLKGGRGADRLRGGPGRDRCRGGAGADSLRSCER